MFILWILGLLLGPLTASASTTIEEIKAISGQTIYLKCPTVTGGVIEGITTSDDISWLKAHETGTTLLPVNKRQEVYENGTLILRDLQKRVDDGIYSCRRNGLEVHSFQVLITVGPMINPFEFPKSIQLGMRVRLLCSILQGDPPVTFSWLKDGKKLDPSPLSLGVRSDDFSMDLTFTRVTPRHNGNYTCVASNDVAFVSHSASLIVDVPPHWKIEPKDTSVVGGQNVLIDCLAEGVPAPVITWERGSSILAPRYYSVISSGPHFEVYANGSLLVKNAAEDDSGLYHCQASNSIGPGLSKDITLTVHVPPRFTSNFQSETVQIGDPTILKCEAIGDNPMTIVWTMDKQPLGRTDDPRYERRDEMSDNRIRSSLKIDSSKRKDSALYTCLVTNSYGDDEMNLRLMVQEPPEAPQEVKSVEVTSRSVKLSWSLPFSGNNLITKYWISCQPPSPEHINGTTRHGSKTRFSQVLGDVESGMGINPEGEEERSDTSPPSPLPLSSPPSAFTSSTFSSISSSSLSPSSSSSSSFSTFPSSPSSSFSFSSIPSSHLVLLPGSGEGLDRDVRVNVQSVPAEEGTSGIIRGLLPATQYHCLVRAENEIGLSPPSPRVTLETDEEAPGGPPTGVKAQTLDARSARISWKAPNPSTWNGMLKGYYVGYKISTSPDQYLYKTIEMTEPVEANEITENPERNINNVDGGRKNGLKGHLSHTAVLSSLRPFTEYTILVQAYNGMGAGPQSDHVTIITEEDVPTLGPLNVRCIPTSPEVVSLTWEPPPTSSINGLLKGYKIIYRPLGAGLGQIRERITANINEIKLTTLLKFTNYSIELFPLNGKGTNPAASRHIYCRTLEDVPGPAADVKVSISSIDSVIVTWKDPINKNGQITKYTVYWREMNKNRTKTAVTVPKGRTNVFSTRYRVADSYPQYKLTGLIEDTMYEVWVGTSTRIGEGPATSPLTFTLSKQIPARILELNDRVLVNAGELVPFVLACHVVGSDPLKKTWTKNGERDELKMEPDGSFLVDSLADVVTNFTCSASNEYGSDTVTYQLVKGASGSTISVKVTQPTFSSAQVVVTKEEPKLVHYRGYELYYRLLGSEQTEWQVKPVPSFSGSNFTVPLDDLICGTTYHLYVIELESETRTDTIAFKTLGSAPIAPKKEQVLKLVNQSSIYIYPSAWDQTTGCPIVKLTIEYRSTNQPTWKLLSSASPSYEVIELSNLIPRSIYSVRMTAHTRGSPSTMAEYEARIGLEEESLAETMRTLSIDTSTMISLVSSGFVLLIGFIAVLGLILYKRKLNKKINHRSHHQHHHRRTSATSASTAHTEESTADHRGRSTVAGTSSNRPYETVNKIILSNGISGEGGSGHKPQLPPPRKGPTPGIQQVLRLQEAKRAQQEVMNSVVSGITTGVVIKGPNFNVSPIKGKLPNVPIPRKQLDEMDNDIYNEYDEITPYATFRLSDEIAPDDEVTEEFKSFTVRIGEPAYCFKGAMDGVPSSLREFKLVSCVRDDATYSCNGGNNHSITSGSSNQTELIRAYEFGRRFHQMQPTNNKMKGPGFPGSDGTSRPNDLTVIPNTILVSGKSPSLHCTSDTHFYNGGEDLYLDKSNLSQVSGVETPTDPGIRRFTTSPPRPNETRVGAYFNPDRSIGGKEVTVPGDRTGQGTERTRQIHGSVTTSFRQTPGFGIPSRRRDEEEEEEEEDDGGDDEMEEGSLVSSTPVSTDMDQEEDGDAEGDDMEEEDDEEDQNDLLPLERPEVEDDEEESSTATATPTNERIPGTSFGGRVQIRSNHPHPPPAPPSTSSPWTPAHLDKEGKNRKERKRQRGRDHHHDPSDGGRDGDRGRDRERERELVFESTNGSHIRRGRGDEGMERSYVLRDGLSSDNDSLDYERVSSTRKATAGVSRRMSKLKPVVKEERGAGVGVGGTGGVGGGTRLHPHASGSASLVDRPLIIAPSAAVSSSFLPSSSMASSSGGTPFQPHGNKISPPSARNILQNRPPLRSAKSTSDEIEC